METKQNKKPILRSTDFMMFPDTASKNSSTGPVLIFPKILAKTGGLLYKYEINFNYTEDIKK